MRSSLLIIFFLWFALSLKASEKHTSDSLLAIASKESDILKKGQLYLSAFEAYNNRIMDKDTLGRKVLQFLSDNNLKYLHVRALVGYMENANWRGHYHLTDSCIAIAQPLLLEFRNDSLLGRLFLEESIAQRRRLNFKASKRAISSSISLFKQANLLDDLAYAYIQNSYLFSGMNDTETALEFAQKSYDLADSLHNQKYLGYAQLLLARLTPMEGESINKKTNLLLSAEGIANQIQDCILRGLVQIALIYHYSELREYELAIKYWDKVVENDKCQGKPDDYYKYYIYHKKGYIYYKMKEYETALKSYLMDYEVLKMELGIDTVDFTKINNQYLKAFPRNVIQISRCYLQLGKIDSAEYWCNHSLEALNLLNHQDGQSQVYYILSEIEKSKDNFEKALGYFQKSIQLKDSTQTKTRFEELKKIEARYENGRLEKENTLLTKEKELSEAKAFQNQLIAVGIGVVAILLTVFAWIFNRQKRRNESLQKEAIEQRFLRSQLNPHFFFNSLVSIHNFVTQNKSAEAGKYLIKFTKLMRSILEHSRLETIPLSEEIITLQSYLELQQLRTQELFEFKIIYADELETEFIQIPPMLFQPVIENCIEHGFRGIKNKGLITITFEEENNWLAVSIKDNGIGRKAARDFKNKLKQTSLSTTINSERINLLNKRGAKKIAFDFIDHHDPSGTEVIIKIPIE